MLNGKLNKWFMRPTPPSGTNVLVDLPVSVVSDIGLVRDENQDRVAAMRVNTGSTKPNSFFAAAVVDGMGGMRDGANCAALGLSAFLNSLVRLRQMAPRERLHHAALAANAAVHDFSGGRGGGTLSALLVVPNHPSYIVNVGDSRIYATFREGDNQHVVRLTVDDSLEEVVGGHGKELLQFIGMGNGLIPHVSEVPQDAERILIASDGIHFISSETLNEVLLNAKTPELIGEELLTIAKWRGGHDNASLAVTVLPQLVESLRNSEESGIEVWDPFCALHIMWMKPENTDTPSTVAIEGSPPRPNALRNKALRNSKGKEKIGAKSKIVSGERRDKGNEPPPITVDFVSPTSVEEEKDTI